MKDKGVLHEGGCLYSGACGAHFALFQSEAFNIVITLVWIRSAVPFL